MTSRISHRAIDATGYVGNGAQALHDDGTWKIPAGGGGGGSAALPYPDDPATFPGTTLGYDLEFDTSGTTLPSGWSWVNQGTSTYEQRGGVALITPQLGSGVDGGTRMLVRSLPTETTWKATVKTTGFLQEAQGCHSGLVLRDSVSGKYIIFARRYNTTGGHTIGYTTWSALEVYGGGVLTKAYSPGSQSTYLQIEKLAGGNFTYRYSSNGVVWAVHSANVAPYATFNQIGLVVQANTASEQCPYPFDWFRVR